MATSCATPTPHQATEWRLEPQADLGGGVVHELNTPLGIVNTAVDMLKKRVQSDKLTTPLAEDRAALNMLEDMQEAAQLATRNISRAHQLVQNFKKISVNQFTDTRETVDLSALVQDIYECTFEPDEVNPRNTLENK